MTAKRRSASGLKWGEGTISERTLDSGELRYVARWLDSNGFTSKEKAKTFLSRTEAEDHLRTIFRAKQAGNYRTPSLMTVSELVAHYIERAAARVSERTILTYRQRAEAMIAPTIGKRKLGDITPLEVQRWIDSLGSGFAPSTIHAAVAVLMDALREAALLGITDRHLGQGIRRPTIGKSNAETWNQDEVQRVLRAVSDDETYGALYHVAISTGLRPGELRALTWADVDLEKATIIVRRTITRTVDGAEIVADRTKTNQNRSVALSPDIVDRLRWHKERQHQRYLMSDAWRGKGIVFDAGDGHFIRQSPWLRWHNRMCARVGVPAIRHHDLRHTAATLMVQAGIHPKLIADILGHQSIDITMDRYAHPDLQTQRQAVAQLSRLLLDSPNSVLESESLDQLFEDTHVLEHSH